MIIIKHFGDITKISGYEAPPVNVIIGGSPCQDLSVAGKRVGLSGERSGLFMEQIRIIKEMREKDAESGRTSTDIRPRFMVWENVPGAFSVNGGRDFAAVLEETIRVAEPNAPDIHVPRNGWTASGCYMGRSWSVAWRVLDAQFFGVPQRRRRIALIADFGGQVAPEVLFERKGSAGHIESCETARKRTSGNAADSTGTASERLNPWDVQSKSIYPENGVCGSLCSGTTEGMNIQPCVLQRDSKPTYCLQGNGIDRADTAGCNGKGWTENVSYTLNTVDRPAVAFAQNQRDEVRDLHDIASCLAAEPGMKQQTYVVQQAAECDDVIPISTMVATRASGSGTNGFGVWDVGDPQFTITANHEHSVCAPTVFGICSDKSNSMLSDNPHSGIYEAETARTIDTSGGNPACNQGGMVVVELSPDHDQG